LWSEEDKDATGAVLRNKKVRGLNKRGERKQNRITHKSHEIEKFKNPKGPQETAVNKKRGNQKPDKRP